MSRFRGRRRGTSRRGVLPGWEPLERRELLAVVTVDATQVVRPVDTQLLGVNVGWWDADLNTPLTKQLVQADGLTFFRLFAESCG